MNGTVQHPDLGEVRYTLHDLPEHPDGQVSGTIDLMRGYALADANDPLIAKRAGYLRDAFREPLDAVHRHVSRNLRFRNDDETVGRVFGQWRPGGMGDVVEVLTRPVDIELAQQYGRTPEEDCDGYSMYVASLLTSLGIPCAFCTVAVDPQEPTRYSHVYVVAYPKEGQYAGRRIAIDASHGPYVGWEAPNPFGKRKEWPVNKIDWFGLALIGGAIAGGWYLLTKGYLNNLQLGRA